MIYGYGDQVSLILVRLEEFYLDSIDAKVDTSCAGMSFIRYIKIRFAEIRLNTRFCVAVQT